MAAGRRARRPPAALCAAPSRHARAPLLLPLLLAAVAALLTASRRALAPALCPAARAVRPAGAEVRAVARRPPGAAGGPRRGCAARSAEGGTDGAAAPAEEAAPEEPEDPEEPEEGQEDGAYDFEAAEVIGDVKVGQQFEGVVTKVMNFGAFVDIGIDRDGLVPRSKLQDGYSENVEDVVKVGDGVTVWVSQFDGDKLTLSMSKNKIFNMNAPRADLSLFEGIDSSEWLAGTVVNVRDFGAFVAVKPPSGGEAMAQGLVHITQIKDGFVENVGDEVSVGDAVKVRVLNVDLADNKLSLTMKSEGGSGGGGGGRMADVSAFEGVAETDWLDGTVKTLQNYGAFVEVQPPNGGLPVQGLVHISQIKEGFIEDPGEELEVDQDVKVRVLEVDVANGKLSLSMKDPAMPA